MLHLWQYVIIKIQKCVRIYSVIVHALMDTYVAMYHKCKHIAS